MFSCTIMSISQKCAMIKSTFEYHLDNYINPYNPKLDVSMSFNIKYNYIFDPHKLTLNNLNSSHSQCYVSTHIYQTNVII